MGKDFPMTNTLVGCGGVGMSAPHCMAVDLAFPRARHGTAANTENQATYCCPATHLLLSEPDMVTLGFGQRFY